MMKRLIYPLMMAFAVATLSACGGSDSGVAGDDGTGEETPPAVVATNIVFDRSSDSYEVTANFDSPENWKAESEDSWLAPAPPSSGIAGSGRVLVVKVAENLSTAGRTGKVTVKGTKTGSVLCVITVNQEGCVALAQEDENQSAPEGMKKNASGIVKRLRVGWNLGNTMESGTWNGWTGNEVDIETCWGNPKTTESMIKAVKNAGFNAIRIPVRWYLHADASMNISDQWMGRVKQVVGYAITNGMYVILNSHHDNWYDRLTPEYSAEEVGARFEKMWKQIATTFRDYDEHLILAGANEVITDSNGPDVDGGEDWGAPSDENRAFLESLMQKFVNTVRATGGNNEWRCLMVQPWAASPHHALSKGHAMPEDKLAGRLIFEFHCYDPYTYGQTQQNDYWGAPYEKQPKCYKNGEAELRSLLDRLRNTFIAKGYPCIMAEFGAIAHTKAPDQKLAKESRAYYLKTVVKEAKSRGIPCFYWDNGAWNTSGENFGLFNRKDNMAVFDQQALDGIMAGLK